VTAKASEDGAYRIIVRKTGESEITAQSGRMVVMAPGGEQWLDAGQRMIARGPRANPQYRIVTAVAWWRRLAGMLQNMQIGGGGGVAAESGGGGEEKTSAAKTSRTKPDTGNSAVSAARPHDSGDRAKTSDGHTVPASGSPHSGDSRHSAGGGGGGGGGGGNGSHAASSHSSGGNGSGGNGGGGGGGSGSHAAPAASSSSSHSSESHSAPASSSHSDSSSKGK
jgi:hypothetical protein